MLRNIVVLRFRPTWVEPKKVLLLLYCYMFHRTPNLCVRRFAIDWEERRDSGEGGGRSPAHLFIPWTRGVRQTPHTPRKRSAPAIASGGEGKKGAPLLWAPIISPSTAWSWTMFYIRMNQSRSCSFGTTSSPAKKGHLRLRRRPPHNFQSNSAPKNCLLTSLGRNQRI